MWPRGSRRRHELAAAEAASAVAASREHLAQVRQRDPEVRQIAGELRSRREQNGFSERLAEMLRAEHGRGHGHASNT